MTKYNITTINFNNCHCGHVSTRMGRWCCKQLIVIVANTTLKAHVAAGVTSWQPTASCHCLPVKSRRPRWGWGFNCVSRGGGRGFHLCSKGYQLGGEFWLGDQGRGVKSTDGNELGAASTQNTPRCRIDLLCMCVNYISILSPCSLYLYHVHSPNRATQFKSDPLSPPDLSSLIVPNQYI
jgi:hypothetical protein